MPESVKKKERKDEADVQGKGSISKEKFFRVRFQAKSNPNDPVDVVLAVNGETLIIQREQEVVVPERFLECADHAVYPTFRQLPGQRRKAVGKIKSYPYDRLGEAKEEDFTGQRESGTRTTREAIKKFGFDMGMED